MNAFHMEYIFLLLEQFVWVTGKLPAHLYKFKLS
jgi:hypothetical protein